MDTVKEKDIRSMLHMVRGEIASIELRASNAKETIQNIYIQLGREESEPNIGKSSDTMASFIHIVREEAHRKGVRDENLRLQPEIRKVESAARLDGKNTENRRVRDVFAQIPEGDEYLYHEMLLDGETTAKEADQHIKEKNGR